MSGRPRWTESGIEDGVCTVSLSKWDHFHAYVYQQMLDYTTYVWRGQRCDEWPLESTLDRLARQRRVARSRRSAFRAEHLDRFKFAARGRRGPNPPSIDGENDWWALGQHHGLATPLLDWTESPFIGAFFAFDKIGPDQTGRRAIWALSRTSVDQKCNELQQAEQAKLDERIEEARAKGEYTMAAMLERIHPRREIEFVRPMSDENQRLVSQAGLFTRAPDAVNVDSWVRTQFQGDSATYRLIKITVPDRDRTTCLRSLNRMNINPRSLFPDLVGASGFCNNHARIDKY